MNVFWETIIRPLLEILQPKTIVEIGAETGKNTRNILEYCRQNDAVLHAIDPLPGFDVAAWQEQYGRHLIFHRSLSLDVLPLMRHMDAVLIDGDHNWYTVSSELKLIEKYTEKEKRPFPLVLIHDVGWPYGRRDLYYNPDNIPPAFLKPYQKKGIKPDSPELAPSGGLNAHLNNAIYENDLQNGVLTAVEDFLNETALQLEFVTLPPYYGLGILFLSELRQNPAYSQFIDLLTTAHPLLKILEHTEKTRLLLAVKKAELKIKTQELKDDLKSRDNSIEEIQAVLRDREKSIEELQFKFESYCRKVEKLHQQCMLLVNLEQRITRLLENPRWKIGCFLAFLKQWKKKKPGSLVKIELVFHQFHRRQPICEQIDGDIQELAKWILELEHNFNSIINSKRWKMGDRVVSFANRLLLKRYVNPEPQPVRSVRELFAHWKRSTGHETKGLFINFSAPVSPEEAMGEPYTLRPPL